MLRHLIILFVLFSFYPQSVHGRIKEMISRDIRLKVLIMLFVLLVCGCGAPFKRLRKYDEAQDRIQTIALYPLHYTDDGKEERLFGMVFSEIFFDYVKAMPMTRPIEFIEEDSTVSLMEAKGAAVTEQRADIVKGATFPTYRQPTPSDLKAISEEAEVLIFCDVLDYKEAGVEEELACAFVSGLVCLPLLPLNLLSSNRNVVKMQFTLFETTTGDVIWKGRPIAQPPLGIGGEQRKELAREIVGDFSNHFPLSASYKGK